MSDVMDALTVLGILVPVLLLFGRDIKTWDNKGMGLIELVIITAIAAGIFLTVSAVRADAAENCIIQDNLEKIKFTCYCPESCPGTVTASGARVREGIIASNRERLGDGAMIYLRDGTFLGFYECLDTGGSVALKNGTAIDVWTPNLRKAKELMKLTGARF